MRDWLETRAPWLVGALDWPAYRLFGRCIPCGQLMILHTPWRLFICERTPLPIEITEKGRALIADAAELAGEPASPAHVA